MAMCVGFVQCFEYKSDPSDALCDLSSLNSNPGPWRTPKAQATGYCDSNCVLQALLRQVSSSTVPQTAGSTAVCQPMEVTPCPCNLRYSLKSIDPVLMAPTCVFLASKVEVSE